MAIALRLLLCWVNPPGNSFDNHYEPIAIFLDTGSLPSKDACFQCYHPPVFYWISGNIAKFALKAGVAAIHLPKLLQFVCCSYGILTVVVCYLILKQFPLSDFARVLSFGTVCFLPRHIYMSAMHGNDTIAYLFVALCVYVMVLAVKRNFSIVMLAVLSVLLTITLFTKYTAFAIVPAVLAVFLRAGWKSCMLSPKRAVGLALATLLLPLSVLGAHMISNMRHYGSPLPWNVSTYDPGEDRPKDPGGINFFTFKPWEEVRTPMLAPGKMHSFWTLVYSGIWFDTEPRYIRYLGPNTHWWEQYHRWYRGEDTFPTESPPLSGLTRVLSTGLIALGLIPLALIAAGFFYSIRGKWNSNGSPTENVCLVLFPVLAVFNVTGIIALTMRLPIYVSMKPSYLLNSTPAFLIFLALGTMRFEKSPFLKRAIVIVFGILFALAFTHFVQLITMMRPVIQINQG